MKAGGRAGVSPRDSRPHSAPESRSALADILQEQRRRIQGEMERLVRRLREEDPPATGDEGERAVSGVDRELGTARVDHLTQIKRQIDDALARHTEGRYGRCVACEAEIPMGRLRSLPFARYCRDCQAAAEERGRAALVGPIA
jgi:DnaK suppressor protein